MVQVIAGAARQKKVNTGKVLSVDRRRNRAIVEGINMVSRHTKPNTDNPDENGKSDKSWLQNGRQQEGSLFKKIR